MLLINVVATALLIYMVSSVPPGNYLTDGLFLVLIGITIAGWATLPIYYLRKKWGRKDSPRFVLRSALRDGLVLGASVAALLTLNAFNELTLVTAVAVVGLAVVCERLL